MIEAKKNPRYELSRYSSLFHSIGLVVSLLFVIAAFEWKVYEDGSPVDLEASKMEFDDIVDIPLTEQPPPPPPDVQTPVIVEVADEEEIEEEIELELDVEMTDETVIEDVVFEAQVEEEVAEEVFSIVEEMPSYPGGNADFYKWVAENLEYPAKARKAGVEGRVILRFVVNKDGSINGVEVLRGIGFGCDEEAVRVIRQSPAWTPGKQRGKPVRVRITVPLNFKLS